MNWPKRVVLLAALDVLCIYLTGLVASLVIIPGASERIFVWSRLALLFLPAQVVINHYSGLYTRLWRYASGTELLTVLMSSTIGAVFVFLVVGYQSGFKVVIFRTVPLYWILVTSVLGGIRFLIRVRREFIQLRTRVGEPTLIIGAGHAGHALLTDILRSPELNILPIGFIDDDTSKVGMSVGGVKVFGTRGELPVIIDEYHVTKVIIAIPEAKPQVIRDIVQKGSEMGVAIHTLPRIQDIVSGGVQGAAIRDVSLEDLLRRDEVRVDISEIGSYIEGKVVLVTGAGGSIGSELCRQAIKFSPEAILLLGKGENSIYNIHRELSACDSTTPVIPLIADVRDKDRMAQVFSQYRPHVVFHAAAHKHVPLMEDNPGEAIKNNVIGTYTVANLAAEFDVERFVLVSTDKAVNPTSVMGASKRAAELVLQLFTTRGTTKYMAVRFGNVLGSRGSVIPLFKEQIARGGPVTVTHPEMVRFFMTIPEAVSLVLQAGALGEGGEVFVLDMGQPVKILDMARDLISLSGLRPDVDIQIKFTGLRPGEKLYEELFTQAEGIIATRHSKIFVAPQVKVPEQLILDLMDQLCSLSHCAESGSATVGLINNLDTHLNEAAACSGSTSY